MNVVFEYKRSKENNEPVVSAIGLDKPKLEDVIFYEFPNYSRQFKRHPAFVKKLLTENSKENFSDRVRLRYYLDKDELKFYIGDEGQFRFGNENLQLKLNNSRQLSGK